MSSKLLAQTFTAFTSKTFYKIVTTSITAILIIAVSCIPTISSASSVGPSSGSSYSNVPVASNPDWLLPPSTQSSDNSYASTTLSNGQQNSDKLQASNFNFNIPSGATITGIEILVEYSASVAGRLRTESLQLMKSSSATGSAYSSSTASYDWSTSDTTTIYGSPTDMWGTTWTTADINDTGFGTLFTAKHSGSGGAAIAKVDNIAIKVYYSVTPVISLSSNISTSTPTNQDIIITATTTSGTLNATSNTFTQNGSFSFVATSIDGNATSTVTITNIDKVAPTLATSTDIGPIEATSAAGAVATFTNPIATDNVDVSVVTTCVAPSGSTFPLGTTGVICNASDTAGNAATSTTFNVLVVDTTAPVIVLNGASTVTVEAGTVFNDLGAIATDNSGNFTASSTHSVNMNVVGDYIVTYTATDASGNVATSTTRTVEVRDTTGPVAPVISTPVNNSILKTANLTLIDWNDVSEISNPVSYIYVAANSPTVDINGALTAPIYTSGALSTSEIVSGGTPEGVYYIQVRGTDSLGNVGAWSTPIKVTVDDTAPVITVDGANPMTIEGGSVYLELGATVSDSVDGTYAATPTGTVNTTVVGSSTITYSATDTAGNVATPVTRVVNVVDTIAPTIVINGANPMTLEAGTAYTELGATVSDNISTPITATATGTVSILVPGSYTITYSAVDGSGNVATSTTRTVNVVDTTAPVINVIGQNPNIVTINNAYVDSGATAADIVDGMVSVVTTGTVDTATLGSYILTYTAVDLTGNVASSTRTVMVIPPDTTAPVITILGTNPVTLEGGSAYIDAGATALDNVNGNLTSSIVTVNSVNNLVVAPYTVTYNVSDGAGNVAIQGVRTVNVVDTTVPVITLNGASIMTLHTGDTYSEPGATALDIVDPAVPVIVGGDTVTTTATSTFTVTYNATDASGNAAVQVTRTVHVVDISVPIITVTGSSTITLEHGTVYTDAGATAQDDVDGDISANIITTGTVNTNLLGSYILTYNVTDSSLNAAMPAIRTVHVVDTTAPVIEVNGSSTISLIVGDVYTELGASSTDAVDGILVATTTGSVDTNTLGTYNLLYSATDLSGNTATTSRSVVVSAAPDIIAPVITILGSNPVSVTVGTTYTDASATTTDNVDLSVPVTASSTVDINTIGSYSVTYNATDTAGNVATPVTRVVNVVAVPTPASTGGPTGGGSTTGGGFVQLLTNTGRVLGTSTAATATTTGRVLGVSTFKFDKNLRLGMKNNDVIELQKVLASLGFFKIGPTGYFGPITLNAVKVYQKSKGIPTTGFVGPLTRAALNK